MYRKRTVKRLFFLTFLLICLTLILNPGPGIARDYGNGLWRFDKKSEFAGGVFEKVIIAESDSGDAVLTLGAKNGKYYEKGVYTSPVYATEPFNRLVLSWNATMPENTKLKFRVQVSVDNSWSSWYVIADWANGDQARSYSAIVAQIEGEKNNDRYGYISIDTLKLRESYLADKFRYQIVFFSADGEKAPQVDMVAVTSFNNLLEEAVEVSALNFQKVDLPVPERSQMIEDPAIARRICSPTSLAMVLEYYGIDLPTEEVAYSVYDHGAGIHGNWIFNTAYAGSFGLQAYVDHYNIQDLKEEVEKGYPVICSIRFKAGELEGAPIQGTSGHLLVVRGFTVKDHIPYIIVNDPAAPDNHSVRREYRVDQFIRAWNGYVYIIRPGD